MGEGSPGLIPRFMSHGQPSGVAAAPDPHQTGRGGVLPLIVTAELAAPDQAWAEGLRRRHYPAGRNRVPAHISLFHQLPPGSRAELQAMLVELARDAGPEAVIDRLLPLGRGVALHVHSPALLAMREELADRFAPLLIPQDRGRPRLHITIQNKVDPAIARATLAELERDFGPRRTRIAALAIWAYAGGPWEPVGRFAFRG